MATSAKDLEAGVRARLVHLRFLRGLTLTETARRAGLAPSTLSRLESGARRLTVGHLAALSGTLGVSPAALLSDDGGEPEGGPTETRDGKRWTPVGAQRSGDQRAFVVDIPASLIEPHLHSHEGFQTIYVLGGRVRLLVDDRDVELAVGETAQFATWRPHWIGAVEDDAQALILFGTGGHPPVAKLI